MTAPHTHILGIPFSTATPPNILNHLAKGGYLVAPAAPALVDLPTHTLYRDALQNAHIVIADSGFMVLCWKLLRAKPVPRISGLRLLETWLATLTPENIHTTFWIHPNQKTQNAHSTWLEQRQLPTTQQQHYLAPLYNPNDLSDPPLIAQIKQAKPQWIIINLGGGTQEILGQYIHNHLEHPCGILCTGAAMAFLSGAQTTIPTWADRLMLGWLFRCCSNPKQYIPRYIKGWKLLPLLIRFREKTPTQHHAHSTD